MKNKLMTVLVVALSVAAGVLGSYFIFKGGEVKADAVDRIVKGTKVTKTEQYGTVKKVKEISLVQTGDGKHVVHIVETQIPKPGSNVANTSSSEDVDEEDLTIEQRMVLKELQDALDDNNIRRVRSVLMKFQAKADVGGLDGNVPVCMRARAVAALGWFGKEAAVDLIDFVADSNEDVSNDAFSAFEQALSDCEMGDRARAKLVTSMMTALTDAAQVDSLLNQLSNMRNSVKAETAGEILSSGTDAAKSKLLEEFEFYFDEDVKDASTLERWKVVNPDDPGDAEMYGGEK